MPIGALAILHDPAFKYTAALNAGIPVCAFREMQGCDFYASLRIVYDDMTFEVCLPCWLEIAWAKVRADDMERRIDQSDWAQHMATMAELDVAYQRAADAVAQHIADEVDREILETFKHEATIIDPESPKS